MISDEVHYAMLWDFVRTRAHDVPGKGISATLLFLMIYGYEACAPELSAFRSAMQRCSWKYSPRTKTWRLPDRAKGKHEVDLSEELASIAKLKRAFDPGYTLIELYSAVWPGRSMKNKAAYDEFTEQVGALGWRRSFNPYWRPKDRPVPSGD